MWPGIQSRLVPKSDRQAEVRKLGLPSRQGAVTASCGQRRASFGTREVAFRSNAYLATREGMRDWLRDVGTWAAAFLIGAAALANITVIFMPLGVWLVLGGLAVFLAGWGASWVVPALGRYTAVICPQCHHQNQVRTGAGRFQCCRCNFLVKPRPVRNQGQVRPLLAWSAGPLSRSPRHVKMNGARGRVARDVGRSESR